MFSLSFAQYPGLCWRAPNPRQDALGEHVVDSAYLQPPRRQIHHAVAQVNGHNRSSTGQEHAEFGRGALPRSMKRPVHMVLHITVEFQSNPAPNGLDELPI